MKKLFEDFKKFIKRGNVVDMAVGVAVAAAFTAIVTAFTKGFITPLLTLITGESDLDEMRWILRPEIKEYVDAETEVVTQAEVAILWGPLVHAVIDFFIIALALFTVMKVASSLKARAEKLHKGARNLLTDADEKEAAAAAEAAAKAEEEKRLAEEAAAAAAEAEAIAKAEAERKLAEEAKAKADAEAKEEARLARQEQLLTEIRDLLKR